MGIYLLLPYDNEKDSLNVGDIVIFDMPKDIEKFVKEREYTSNDTNTFIKTVGAIEGMSIEVREEKLFIDGKIKGEVAPTDTLEREYTSNDTNTFIKTVGAIEGMSIEVREEKLFIDGKIKGEVAPTDTFNRILPQIENFVVSKGYFFPLGTHFHSFDGRYYGQIDKKTIRNKAKLLIGF